MSLQTIGIWDPTSVLKSYTFPVEGQHFSVMSPGPLSWEATDLLYGHKGGSFNTSSTLQLPVQSFQQYILVDTFNILSVLPWQAVNQYTRT